MSDLEIKYSIELAQIRNIIDGDVELTLLLLREHTDDLGLASVSDYSEVLGIPKRTVQDRLRKGFVPYFEISGFKFPCINL